MADKGAKAARGAKAVRAVREVREVSRRAAMAVDRKGKAVAMAVAVAMAAAAGGDGFVAAAVAVAVAQRRPGQVLLIWKGRACGRRISSLRSLKTASRFRSNPALASSRCIPTATDFYAVQRPTTSESAPILLCRRR